MLESTASESIQCWLQNTTKLSTNTNTPKTISAGGSRRVSNNSTISSIQCTDSDQAYKLYLAGHSLYCRAPLELEEIVVGRIMDEIGDFYRLLYIYIYIYLCSYMLLFRHICLHIYMIMRICTYNVCIYMFMHHNMLYYS